MSVDVPDNGEHIKGTEPYLCSPVLDSQDACSFVDNLQNSATHMSLVQVKNEITEIREDLTVAKTDKFSVRPKYYKDQDVAPGEPSGHSQLESALWELAPEDLSLAVDTEVKAEQHFDMAERQDKAMTSEG